MCYFDHLVLVRQIVNQAEIDKFQWIDTIGTGTFGIVRLCRLEGVDRPLSMKILSKSQVCLRSLFVCMVCATPSPAPRWWTGPVAHMCILQLLRLNQEVHIISERDVLTKIRHPFVVTL